MPTIITTPSWKTTFALSATPKQFQFLDTTDYTTTGIALTGVRGVFQITSPSGVVIYNNTSYGSASDIVANVSLANAITIALPNLANQAPEQGDYIITYTARIVDGTNPTYYITDTLTYDFTYASPVVCISPQVDCIQPLFTASDATDYVVNSITPTNDRTMTLEYPANSGGGPVTNATSATITTSTLYNGLQVVTVESVLNYEVTADIFYITDLVEGTKSINVDCSYVCQLYCCLKSLRNNVENNRGVNSVEFARYENLFSQAMAQLQLLFLAIDCGKQEDANAYIASIKTISNCTDDCSCTDGSPSRVTGLGIQDVNVEVVSGGSPITVTPSTSGGVTTYTVSFDQTLVTKINDAYNTIVSATDSTVTITDSGVVSGVRTFGIKANYVVGNRMEFRCGIVTTTIGAPVITITNSNYLYSGTNMNATATVANVTVGLSNGKNLNNLFRVSGFQVSANNNYKVSIESAIMGLDFNYYGSASTVTAANMYLGSQVATVEVLNQISGQFDFRFVGVAGRSGANAALSNDALNSIPNIILNIKISE